MDEYTKLLYGLASIAIVGYVSWSTVAIISLRIKVALLELKQDDIKEMKDDIKTLTSIVWEIAAKLNIPIRRD